MNASSKRAALRFYSLALAAAVALALGLPALRFEPGIALPEADRSGSTLIVPAEGAGLEIRIDRLVLSVFLALLAVVVLWAAVRKILGMDWRRVLAFAGKTAAAVLGFSLFLLIATQSFPRGSLGPPKEIAAPPAPVYAARSAPKEAPAAIVWIVAGATLALALALCLRLILGGRPAEDKEDRVALEAESARLALLRGGDFKGVILDCYRRMGRAMEEERGIEREESMTAREFEALLLERGVSGEGVSGLTRLFESARYGDRAPSPEEEREAVTCLASIERDARKGRPQ